MTPGTWSLTRLTAVTSFTDTGLIAGTVYSYALFANDSAGNHSVAVNVTLTVTAAPTAACRTAVLTGHPPMVEFFDFDASGSTAAIGKTLSTGTLDYGDGTPRSSLSDEFGWIRQPLV